MSIFDTVPAPRVKRSTFNLSRDNKFTCNFGDLVPVLCQEVLPGDVFRHSHQIYAQFAPLDSQLMQAFDIRCQYFMVTNRMIWNNFENFLKGGADGDTLYQAPNLTFKQVYTSNPALLHHGSLADYMGLPTKKDNTEAQSFFANNTVPFSTLPFRAYQMIYNYWYRDENLDTEIAVPLTDGSDSANIANLLTMRKRAWKKDYFTSALPWPQKGSDVTIPIAGNAPIKAVGDTPLPAGQGIAAIGWDMSQGGNPVDVNAYTPLADGQSAGLHAGAQVYADLDAANVTSLNDFRTAQAIELWQERNARAGGRWKEFIRAHFGTNIPDYRLEQPEYIGGSVQPVNIGNVYSTNSNVGSNVQAQPVSIGQSSGVSANWKYKCHEHGYIIGILSVQPKASYFQGLPRSFSRMDRFDYYFPEFANLGEQAILKKELYLSNNVSSNNSEFGYTPRYAEYKTAQDEIHGDYRNINMFGSYHDARVFASQPSLNSQFIKIDPAFSDLHRIFNYTGTEYDHVYVDIFHNLKARRPMPYFGIPKALI